MAEPAFPQTLPAAGADPRSAPRKTLVARLAGSVASHAYVALAAIVVLVILLAGMYVYYHGLLFLGPYAAKGARAPASAGAAGGAAEDPETERLINDINRH